MSMEDAIYALANAINRLAEVHAPSVEVDVIHTSPPCEAKQEGVDWPSYVRRYGPPAAEEVIISLEDLGQPTMFKNRCSICGELGRNSRTCQPTTDGSGSYHWKVTQE